MNLSKQRRLPVVDLFAGPGGLGEGFSVFKDRAGILRFNLKLSIEKDYYAHMTLELRAFYRSFKGKPPDEYYNFLRGTIGRDELFLKFTNNALRAKQHARLGTLGELPEKKVDKWIEAATKDIENWVLIGGPPCQAYSIAGRSRNKGNSNYSPENDQRHFLYKEYLRIISEHWPTVFIFENVKGLISARINGDSIFQRILDDLQNPSLAMGIDNGKDRYHYNIYSFSQSQLSLTEEHKPSDFIVESELYGIPQARHRIFLLGIREDLSHIIPSKLKVKGRIIPAKSVLEGLPKLRSKLSRELDNSQKWKSSIRECVYILGQISDVAGARVARLVQNSIENIRAFRYDCGGTFISCSPRCRYKRSWFLDEKMKGICNHESRSHIAKDLHRYLFCACYAKVMDRSPLMKEFPDTLFPAHKNVSLAVKQRHFPDRFRVQLNDHPSTTITSHIGKDGHHFIHPDPKQCRSLTVREAARIQTFPDNYFFCGPRTQQYFQVGNAVPPLLAEQIAAIVYEIFKNAELIN